LVEFTPFLREDQSAFPAFGVSSLASSASKGLFSESGMERIRGDKILRGSKKADDEVKKKEKKSQ